MSNRVFFVIAAIVIALLVLGAISGASQADESMASHEAHAGQAASAPERADGLDPDNVIADEDWQISTDGELHDFGPIMKDDGSDNQGVDYDDLDNQGE